jgi:anaerobic selenocysteine-containing dehydrogenase
MNLKLKRRSFLKVLGWGGAGATLAACDRPSFVTHREGRNPIVPYQVPEEFVIPGVGIWYASTCQQCPTACGIHGRVREGRALKLEGNPESPLNKGKLCAMGQSGLQTHYNPDRLTRPRVRRGGQFVDIDWDEALALVKEQVGPDSGRSGDRIAWVTDTISGHQAVLVEAFMEAVGSSNLYVHEAINDSVWRQVCQDMLGEESPRLRIDKAAAIFSLGADFLGTWAQVPYSVQYADFRTSPRGVLLAAEPKMTLTGANADLWVPVRPGAEGVLALAVANVLVTKHGRSLAGLSDEVQTQIRGYDARKAAEITGTTEAHINRIAELLNERAPSLVLAGAAAEGHPQGYDSVAAAMTLNLILGNVGKTIESNAGFPFPDLKPRRGNGRSMIEFAKALDEGRYDVVFIKGANPVFTTPSVLGLRDKLQKAGFKVSLSQFEDETTQVADLVLPLYSAIEDWGTHVPSMAADRHFISLQQPLMEPLYPHTRGFGDTVLALLKMRGVETYAGFADYHDYLRKAFAEMPVDLKGGAPSEDAFWRHALMKGVLEVGTANGALTARPASFRVTEPSSDSSRPFWLLPSANPTKWDGRHANIPWIQELPDPVTKVVWDSWAEMHPATARRFGLSTGDVIAVNSEHGSFETYVYVYKGMHPEAISVPMGQGHTVYGRYAAGRGANPLVAVGTTTDSRTGEPAHHATRISFTKVRSAPRVARTVGSRVDQLIMMGGSETQMGRKLVATVTSDQYERNERGRG